MAVGGTEPFSFKLQFTLVENPNESDWEQIGGELAVPSYKHDSLESDTPYYYRVSAVNAAGTSVASSPVLKVTTLVAPPLPPEFTEITTMTDSATLTWNHQAKLDGYMLEYRVSGTTAWTAWTSAPGADDTSATIAGVLDANTKYDFRLTAENASGDASSTESKTTFCNAPSGLTNDPPTWESISLSWTAPVGGTEPFSFKLQFTLVENPNESDWEQIGGELAVPSYKHNSLESDTPYYYRVSAINDAGASDWSNTLTATTDDLETPMKPTGLKVDETLPTGVMLIWNAVPEVTQYIVQQLIGGIWRDIATVTKAIHAVYGLTPATGYQFRVIAENDTGKSDPSDPVGVTTPSRRSLETPSIIVTTLLDIVDANDGAISLREAIAYANPGDTIMLGNDLSGTIILNGSELYIDKDITIVCANTTIDANEQSRAINIASGTTVTLVGLTITGGKTSGNGGGILNGGTLILTDCVVTGNEMKPRTLSSTVMSGGFGGGIYNGGKLFVYGGEITDNKAPFFTGGGLYNEGMARLDDCMISGNEAEWGSGIANTNHGTMTITSSVITNNTAKKQGGGIANAGTVTLDRDTFDSVIENDPDNFYGKDPIVEDTIMRLASSLNIAVNTPTYEISSPAAEDLFEINHCNPNNN